MSKRKLNPSKTEKSKHEGRANKPSQEDDFLPPEARKLIPKNHVTVKLGRYS